MAYRKTIILAEDYALVREQIGLILGDEYEVLQAKDGDEALAIYKREAGRVGLVLTDCDMPVMDGVQLTSSLRRQDPELPVILMIGGAERADFPALLRQGRVALLWKPFDAIRLKELISFMTERMVAAPAG